MGEIIYNGRSSKEIGLEVETFPSYVSPKRSYEKVHVPGRNGDLIIDNGSWENTTRSYSVSIGSYERDYYEMINKVSEWLHSSNTYTRLEDSYEPDVYRLAVYLQESSMTNIMNQGGKGTIEFDCKPQRFLKVGDNPVAITAQTIFHNPTGFLSLPIINVYGNGSATLVVGSCTVQIHEIGGGMTIDSEIQDAYWGTANKNSMVSFPDGFPKMNVGTTVVGFSGGITRVEVIPKWYTL